ncbi:hypothetical protein SARC_00693 [Sphaeroforma arctica JP610]|uniref:Uncharacterized protein n=1 Tax=Sphaeroforma arctica JP610 TaxID=667725 RepID=A0A0L0GDT8_9EUKA|nr:hypothetical protein SARC_00693 [Sphaeroforma arctica JP610]KNC87165.1 hypothetical protein SARC_00693 [Sphaeroforma arctica JP610]|eukprot:XP_014161067.1 hypothetical protein SARC_00693 [Sphaeroforma arctica JP610]
MSIRICKKKFVQIVNDLEISTTVESELVDNSIGVDAENTPEVNVLHTNHRTVQRRWDGLKHDLAKLRANTAVDPGEKKQFMHEVARCLPIIDLRLSAAQTAHTAALHLDHGNKHLDNLKVAMEAVRIGPAHTAHDRLKEDRFELSKIYPFPHLSSGQTLDSKLKQLTLDVEIFTVASDTAIRRYEQVFPAEAEAHRQQRKKNSIDRAAPVRQLVKESNQLSKDILSYTRQTS